MANGKAGFYMDGSYVTAEVSKEIPGTWKTGVILPPGVTQADVGTFGFSIPKKAKNISAAEQFIAFFMQKSQLSGISTIADNISSRPDVAAPPELAAVQQALSAPKLRVDFSNTIPSDYYNKVYNQNFLDFWHGKTTAAHEMRGSSVEGGVERKLAPGDVVSIPAKLPHWVKVAPGKDIGYFIVKVTQ